jgi:hypothetical protein
VSREALPLVALVLIACPTTTEPVPEPLHVAGRYSISGQQEETSCFPPDWQFWDLLAFMEHTATDVPAMTLDITQDGARIEADEGPAGCVWEGSVGVDGTFSLSGPCDDANYARDIALQGNITTFGTGFDLAGTMRIDVFALPRDESIDCVVDVIRLDGTGAPL